MLKGSLIGCAIVFLGWIIPVVHFVSGPIGPFIGGLVGASVGGVKGRNSIAMGFVMGIFVMCLIFLLWGGLMFVLWILSSSSLDADLIGELGFMDRLYNYDLVVLVVGAIGLYTMILGTLGALISGLFLQKKSTT
jgi:hypothetical protein